MESSFHSTWTLPAGLVLLLLVVAALIVTLIYWHESAAASRLWKLLLAAVRVLLIVLVILMAYGWTMQRHRTDLPDVVIVLDDSASMGLVDAYDPAARQLSATVMARLARVELDKPTRLNLAKTLLLENKGAWINELSRRYHVRFYLAGESARALAASTSEASPAQPVTSPAPATIRELHAEQPASRLGNCLRDVLEAQRGRPTAAIVMFTDGVTTDGKSLVQAAGDARERKIPLFLVGLGSERPARDLKLTDLLADEMAFAGDLLHFDVKLSAEGYGGAVTVQLRMRGQESEAIGKRSETAAEPVDRRETTLEPDGGTQAVRLSHRAVQPGEYEYVIEVAPRADEENTENNRLVHRVTVRDDSIRVLLVQAYPSYEFRFLKTMLTRQLDDGEPGEAAVADSAEPAIRNPQSAIRNSSSLHTVLQEADLEYTASDKTALRSFPVSREELFRHDVLIFGDVNPALLSPSIMSNIYEFVTARGGGVIFIAGPRYTPLAYRNTPLAALFPMNVENVSLPEASGLAEPFRPRLTPLGQASSIMQLSDPSALGGANERLWREELTPLRWFIDIPSLRPGARVLAEHPTRRNPAGEPLPIICLQFVGAGKVIFHATDETHRWRLSVGDVYFARYWMQAIRYLCRAQLLAGRTAELTTSRDDYRLGDAVGLRVRYFDDRQAPAEDDGVAVVVQARSGGLRQRINLMRAGAAGAARGIFEGSAGLLPAGQYQAWLALPAVEGNIPSHEFSVVAATDELSRTQMDAAAMREAAQIARGKFYTFDTADRLASDLPPGRKIRVESLPPVPIWNTPAVAGLFVLLIGLEWLLRRRVGML